MTFVGEEPASAGCISLRDKGAITAESLRTTTLEALSDKGADRYSEHTIIGDVTINDSGAIILHSGKQITLTRGSLTLGNGVAMVLLDAGGEFAVGDILVTCISGTITGDFSELDFLVNNEQQEGYRVEISEDSSMDTVSEWDSVAHIQLMFELEGAFGITIKSEEISELVSVQKMMDAVERKLNH